MEKATEAGKIEKLQAELQALLQESDYEQGRLDEVSQVRARRRRAQRGVLLWKRSGDWRAVAFSVDVLL